VSAVGATSTTGRTVVIGVGNPFRRDDGVGDVTVQRVRNLLPRGDRRVVVTSLDGEPTRLLDAWGGAGLAIVIDAMRSGAAPGSIERIEVDLDSPHPGVALPAAASAGSTHSAGVGEAIGLGRVLGRLPGRLVVYGLEGADFGEGPGLSPEASCGVEVLTARLCEELWC